ncbi:MAG: HAD family hydrolase [Mycobacterium sp.]
MIYSRAAAGTSTPDSELECVEYYEGEPLSYMTTAAVAALRDLAGRVAVVPTTTRTVEQFQRIQLPGAPWRYAITSNGGNILRDGAPDAGWRASIDAATRDGGAGLPEVAARLRSLAGDWVSKFRLADDLFCYLVVHPEAVPPDFMAEWGTWCAEHGWGVSQQGRKIYTMPNAVCKSFAIAEVRARLIEERELDSGATILAAGDGGLDAEMLASADAAIRPRHGELELLGWTHDTVTVTTTSGIRATEEILGWFNAQLARTAGDKGVTTRVYVAE